MSDSRAVAVVLGEPVELGALRDAVLELDDVRARLRLPRELLHRPKGGSGGCRERGGDEERERGCDSCEELHGGRGDSGSARGLWSRVLEH